MVEKQKPVEEIVADRVIANTMAWGHDYIKDNRNMRVLVPSDFGIQSRLNFVVNNKSGKQIVHIFDADNRQQINLGLQSLNNVVFNLEAREIVKEGESGLSIVQNLEEGALLIEYGIGGEEIIEILNKIENKAKEMELFNEIGTRKRPENISLIAENKMEVSKVFSKEGLIYPLLGKDPEEIRQKFDKPEDLILRQDPYTGKDFGFINKKDLDYFEKHDKIVNDVLIEMEISINDLMALLEKDEKLAILIAQEIKREVDKRMEEN